MYKVISYIDGIAFEVARFDTTEQADEAVAKLKEVNPEGEYYSAM